jgi:hypothetical protein
MWSDSNEDFEVDDITEEQQLLTAYRKRVAQDRKPAKKKVKTGQIPK